MAPTPRARRFMSVSAYSDDEWLFVFSRKEEERTHTLTPIKVNIYTHKNIHIIAIEKRNEIGKSSSADKL